MYNRQKEARRKRELVENLREQNVTLEYLKKIFGQESDYKSPAAIVCECSACQDTLAQHERQLAFASLS